mmetsp:Transcript_43463/g.105355  ORF Transcript_43463/g.105355 Transcript_43463/m.105355 type:complete len:877 (+) Transcript_43463:409-3039(+)
MMDDLDLLDAEKQANGKAAAAPVEAEGEAEAKAASSTIDDAVICSTPKRAKQQQQQQQHQKQQLHGRARGVTQRSHQKDVAVVGDSPTATASYSSRGGGGSRNGDDDGRSIDGSNNNDETLLDGFCVEYQQQQQQSPMGPDVTPRPLLARIGRVVVEGDGDDDYSDDDGNAVRDIQDLALDLTKSTGKESKQELTQRQRQQPRRTFRRRSTTVSRSQQQDSSSTNEGQEVDDTSPSSELCLALQRLNRFAVMDSTEYRQRLVESSFPDASGLLTSQRSPATALSESETRALLHLSRSIHRLQSAAANLTTEVDSHTDDMLGLQQQLEEAQKRNSMLEMAVQKLHERNRKLKARSEKDKKKCEILTSKVLQTEQKLNEQGFQLMANQVQNHEHQLLHQTSSSVVVGEEEGRERTDSSFSEVMSTSTSQKLDPECCGGRKTPPAGQDEVLPTDGMNNSSDVYSVGSSATMSTMTHSMSKMNHGQQQQQQQQQQLIFDNFGPTLCFSAQSSSTRSQRSCFSYGSGNDFVDGSFTEDDITMTTTTTSIASNSPKSPWPYTVSGRPSVPHVKDNAASNKDRTNVPTMPSLHNPFSKLLGPRQVQPYTLRMVPPFEMQYVALSLPVSPADRSDINPVTHESVTCGEASCVVEDHGMVLSNGESSQPQSDFAFAVCGFNGFSQDFNCKPSLGARLLQINDKPVDPTWTIVDLQEALKCHGRTKLTFRNDRWTKEQDQVLQAAIGRGGVSDETTLPAPRQRASSSDSVGKAIYGIGTLITNQFQASGHQKTILTPAGDVTVDMKEEESPSSPVKDSNSNPQLCLVDNGEKQPTSGSKSEQQAIQQHSTKEINDEQQQKACRGKEAASNIRSRLTGVGKLLLIID